MGVDDGRGQHGTPNLPARDVRDTRHMRRRDTWDMEPEGAPIGVAVLGAGRMGQTHLRNLASIAGARVVVVADPDLAAAERGRRMARAERAVSDAREAIVDPAVDAVVIVTPTSTHAGLIEAAVDAGKAVWSEKPIALDLAETTRVAEVIRRSGRPVQVGFMRRFDPGYAAAKARIDAGELGRIELFRALSRDTYPPRSISCATRAASSWTWPSHDLDLARFLVGEVEEVQAWGCGTWSTNASAQANDFDTAVTMLRFRDGALGVVETARHSEWGYDIRTEVAGASGKIVVEAVQKTPALFSRRFGFEGDHFENFPDRFESRLPSRARGVLRGHPRGPPAHARARGRGRDPAPGAGLLTEPAEDAGEAGQDRQPERRVGAAEASEAASASPDTGAAMLVEPDAVPAVDARARCAADGHELGMRAGRVGRRPAVEVARRRSGTGDAMRLAPADRARAHPSLR